MPSNKFWADQGMPIDSDGDGLTDDFEQRVADVSVDHPNVVENYRGAHEVWIANEQGKAETEDLRRAMVHYRSLFEELLERETPEAERLEAR